MARRSRTGAIAKRGYGSPTRPKPFSSEGAQRLVRIVLHPQLTTDHLAGLPRNSFDPRPTNRAVETYACSGGSVPSFASFSDGHRCPLALLVANSSRANVG